MADWALADIGDWTGRTVVVTGANSGTGLATARALAAHGARVVLACRDLTAAGQVAHELGADRAVVRRLDLADLTSVADFARQSATEDGPLAGLVNNAGVMAGPLRSSAQGFELQMATNHLGHAALTAALWPQLAAHPDARVVTVSSLAARGGRLDAAMTRESLVAPVPYRPGQVYANTKQANLLFALELARRAAAAGSSVRSVAAHPGVAATNLFPRQLRDQGFGWLVPLARPVIALVLQSAAAGALPPLRALTDPRVPPGGFVVPSGPGQARGAPAMAEPFATGRDPAVADRLWQLTAVITSPFVGSLPLTT